MNDHPAQDPTPLTEAQRIAGFEQAIEDAMRAFGVAIVPVLGVKPVGSAPVGEAIVVASYKLVAQ